MANKINNEVPQEVRQQIVHQADMDIAAAYLLFSLANEYIEETKELFEKIYCKLDFEIRSSANSMMIGFNQFNKRISELVIKDGNGDALCEDYDYLKHMIKWYIHEPDKEKWNWQMRYYWAEKQRQDLAAKLKMLEEMK